GEDYIISLKAYLLSFNMDLFVSRMNQSLVCSLRLSSHDFIKSWMEQLILPVGIDQDLKPMYRSLKKNKELKQAYKGLKSTYPSLRDYIEFNGKLAFLTFVCQQLGVLEQPYDYLINYENGMYRPAILFYEFMSRSLKNKGQSVEEYIAYVILTVELDSYEDRSTMILNQQGEKGRY
ncbi:MAG: hypothetical protein K2G70_03215, partial [Turicibacter sp.]|nr:hypothetical protein [Turicibacter sp.]